MKAPFHYTREEVVEAMLRYHNSRYQFNKKQHFITVLPLDGTGEMTVLVADKPKEDR